MKSVMIIAFLPCLAAVRVTSDGAGAGAGAGNGDASGIQNQLNQVLAAGNARLQSAEQAHEQVLTGVRTAAGADMSAHAQVLGSALANYTKALKDVQTRFSTAINATQAGLDELAPSLDITSKARIGAKIAVAQRQLKRAKRTQTSGIEAAGRHADSVLDHEGDAMMQLWVGDLSKPLADAKEKMHEVAEADPNPPAAAAAGMDDDDDGLMDVLKGHGISGPATTTTTTTTTTTKAPKKAAFLQKKTAAELETEITNAGKAMDADTKAALKAMNDAVAKAEKDVATFLKDTKAKLQAAEKQAEATVSQSL